MANESMQTQKLTLIPYNSLFIYVYKMYSMSAFEIEIYVFQIIATSLNSYPSS